MNLSITGRETVLMTVVSQGEQISEAYLPIIELRKTGSDEQSEIQFEQMLSAIIDHKDRFGMDKRYAKVRCQGLGSMAFSLGETRFEQTEKVFLGKSLQCKFDYNRFNCIEVINS